MTAAFRERRLNNELKTLSTEFDKDKREIKWTSPHGRHYRLIIPEEYPFKPPQIYQNHCRFGDIIPQQWMLKRYQKKHGTCGCIRCTDIMSRWSPCMKISDIIEYLTREEERWFEMMLDVVNDSIHLCDITHTIAEFV